MRAASELYPSLPGAILKIHEIDSTAIPAIITSQNTCELLTMGQTEELRDQSDQKCPDQWDKAAK